MHSLSPNLRGIALMVMSTGAFTINDTLLKLATEELPPFQSLFLRGIAASLWGIPLLAITGNLRRIGLVFDRHVQMRNGFELVAVYGFILALAHAPIADITAISQLSPMLVTLGAFAFFGERIGRLQVGLVLLAFIGALMVAQPGASGFTVFALFGFWNAAAGAARDLAGRRVDASVPGLVVAMGAGLVVMFGAGIATALFETWQAPSLRVCLLITCSAFFLMFGHFFIFTAYRNASLGAVVPFLYTSTLWALISGVVVFGTVPNLLAGAGMVIILVCGVGAVLIERRHQRLIPAG